MINLEELENHPLTKIVGEMAAFLNKSLEQQDKVDRSMLESIKLLDKRLKTIEKALWTDDFNQYERNKRLDNIKLIRPEMSMNSEDRE